VVVVVLVLAGGAAAAYFSSGWVRHQASLSVTHRPEPFTALYFTHPHDLSQLATTGQSYLVEVTAADHDGAAPRHLLTVNVSVDNLTVPVARRTFTLARNGQKDETFDFVLPLHHLVYDLIFTLDNAEHLHWRVLSS
jgi:hypothetical protein